MSNLTLHQKQLEKEEKAKCKVSRNIGIIKIRVDFFLIATKNSIEKINETKGWFSAKIHKIDIPLARLIEKKKRGPKSVTTEMKKQKLKNKSKQTKNY